MTIHKAIFDLVESPLDDEGVRHYSVVASPAHPAAQPACAVLNPNPSGGALEQPSIPSNQSNLNTETTNMFDDEIKTPAPGSDSAPDIFPFTGKQPELRPQLPVVASGGEQVNPPAENPEMGAAGDTGETEKVKKKAPSRKKKGGASADPLLAAVKEQVAELRRFGDAALSSWRRGHRELHETLALVARVNEENSENEERLGKALSAIRVKPAKVGEPQLNKRLLPIVRAALGVYRPVKGEAPSGERGNLARKASDYSLALAEASELGKGWAEIADFLGEPGTSVEKLAKAHRVRLRGSAAPKVVVAPRISDMVGLGFADITGVDGIGDGAVVLVAVRMGNGRLEVKRVVADEALAQRVIKVHPSMPAALPEA